MCPFTSHKAQGAIEFAIMLGIVIVLFLGIFIYLNQQFNVAEKAAKQSKSLAKAQQIRDEVFIAATSPAGYSKKIDFTFFDQLSKDIISFEKNPYGLVRVLVVTDVNGFQQIYFLNRRTAFYENACDGQNEIIRTIDGVGMCCTECNGSLPGFDLQPIMCQPADNRLGVDDAYVLCTNMTLQSDSIENIRVYCPVQGGAEIRLYGDVNPSPPPLKLVASTNTTRRIPGTPYYVTTFEDITGGDKSVAALMSSLGVSVPQYHLNISARCLQQINPTGTNPFWINYTAVSEMSTGEWCVGNSFPC